MTGKEFLLRKRNKMKKPVLIFLLLQAFYIYGEAIVNIEDQRNEGKVGFFSKIGSQFSGSRGNEDRDFYSLNLRLDNNTENIESFLIAQTSERKKNEIKTSDSTFVHGRLIFLNQTRFSTEFFAQHSKNPFRSFLQRDVIGFGTRINLGDSTKLGFGLLTEDEEDLQGIETDTERLSMYFTDKYLLAENIDLLLTAYFQPSLDETDDYKASILTGLNFSVNENVSISLQISSFYDSRPPEFADKQDEQISTEFSYSF